MTALALRCLAIPLLLLPLCAARAEGPMIVDSAEIYCTDAARPGFSSFGVQYARQMPNHFGGGLAFCRVDMQPLSGPQGGATVGWSHDAASGTTTLWCRARAGATAGESAEVRARFALHAIAAGTTHPACSPAREGRLP